MRFLHSAEPEVIHGDLKVRKARKPCEKRQSYGLTKPCHPPTLFKFSFRRPIFWSIPGLGLRWQVRSYSCVLRDDFMEVSALLTVVDSCFVWSQILDFRRRSIWEGVSAMFG